MKAAICAIFFAIIGFAPAASHAQNWTGNINFFLGGKTLKSSDWAPVEDHGQGGILVDFKKDTWPVSIAIDLLSSYTDEVVWDGVPFKVEAETMEINIGVRKIWDHFSIIRPYVGGGVAYINAELTGASWNWIASQDDSALGIWLNGGVYWTLARAFNIGLDFRYSKAEVTLFGNDVAAGGRHAGLLLGYHW
jgi:opacity protein-like surface antigen